ncbi:MAG: hypothetical protein ACRD2H_03250 [Terriglobales bacterium]
MLRIIPSGFRAHGKYFVVSDEWIIDALSEIIRSQARLEALERLDFDRRPIALSSGTLLWL